MIKQFWEEKKEPHPPGLDGMEMVQLIDIVRACLQQKRYVVVFDDVWSIDLWNSIEKALVLNGCGSRIMLTTRMVEVANYCVESPSHVYTLQPLRFEDAWELFCKKALGGDCPLELHEWSVKIVNKCDGMPLAVVTIGGLLSTKDRTASEWKLYVV
ncbi:PREDICTED: disease resistance protein RPM1-like [Nelumbo nucifera]|uniref:Disease resistance protein RPM1-like n=2 Tax=Nelumbo nucifera TaxID=4432 RepID=A0A1U7ZAK4_NELNU|nr:PREDICTED: disease resistance protein RPM1-like [Nelumbo nucifera]DAD24978.1 TPA_asm: hypothetical protein HUJ06_026442 [Nelumbo nucifera]